MSHDAIRRPLLLCLALFGCALPACVDGGRLPVCKTDADCVPKEDEVVAGPICYDLRCVQCRYDDDCEVGHICNSALECERLSPKPPPDPDSRRKRGKKKPANWAKCAEACEDEACLQACEEQGAGETSGGDGTGPE